MPRPEWIRELDAPQSVIDALADIGIHRCQEFALRASRGEVSINAPEDDIRKFVETLWRDYIGMPIKLPKRKEKR